LFTATPQEKRGGGPPRDVGPPMFILRNPNPVPQVDVPLRPFFSETGSDLLHSRQQFWECLLLAFRAAVRARGPSLRAFLDDLRSTDRFRNVDESAESGISFEALRIWLSAFRPDLYLLTIRRHQWSIKSVVNNFFGQQVLSIFT
jgi:hypothetical protein